MLLKPGVRLKCLRREIRRALNVIEEVYINIAGHESIITSTDEGTHSPGSLHYAGQAVDIALPGAHNMYVRSTASVNVVVKKLKEMLGKDYDVVLEKDHIHVEYDPK